MKLKLSKRTFRILIIIGTELVLVLLLLLIMHVRDLNSSSVIEYADKENADQIYAENGYLKINNIRINVPGDNADYGISYDWAEDDEEYPSVPVLASVAYFPDVDEAVQPEYEILFYKSAVTPSDEIPEGKTAGNWYDDWEPVDSEGLEQRRYDNKLGSGFMITAMHPDALEGQASATFSYTFAVETDAGIEQYTIECNCYDTASIEKVRGVFTGCIDSLSETKAA